MKENKKPSRLNTGAAARLRADLARKQNLLGTRLAAARKRQGLTQGELSSLLRSCGVNVQTPAVNKWEKGETVPNAYQLLALMQALSVEEGFSFFTGPAVPPKERLNAEGRRMLKSYREFLESKTRYTVSEKLVMIEMPVSRLPASAGYGDYLDGELFDMQKFPESAVPDGADFAVPVDGDSMEPLYRDGQLVWVRKCACLNVGEVGLFVADGQGYLKTYDEQTPDEAERDDYTDSSGFVHPKVVLISQNEAYAPKVITPFTDFRIIGRVLN